MIGTHYKIGKKIGSGNHGEIFYGEDTRTTPPLEVAIKLEPVRHRDAQLLHEARIYKSLGNKGKDNTANTMCLIIFLVL